MTHTTKTYDQAQLAALLPVPASDAHKYSRGRVVLVAGSSSYPGAALLCTRAALRMGAGYTELFTTDEARAAVLATMPSVVLRPSDQLDQRFEAKTHPNKPCAVVIGCGFDAASKADDTALELVLSRAQAPVLVDGGALGALVDQHFCELLAQRAHEGWPTVLTPHMGEAARLLDPLHESCDLAAHPDAAAALLARSYQATVLLKGAVSYVSDGVHTYVMAQGTAALAKAGTGDVLAGMTGALLAQGLDPLDACMLGASLHAQAGRAAARRESPICVCAEDIPETLPEVICDLLLVRSESEGGNGR